MLRGGGWGGGGGFSARNSNVTGGGVWFPANSIVTCTGKGVNIWSTNQWTRINSYILGYFFLPCIKLVECEKLSQNHTLKFSLHI